MKPELVMVVCNEAHRLEPLLQHLRPYFDRMSIVVQESDDDTLKIVKAYADAVGEDRRQGFGDASMPVVQRLAQAPWVFRVDADEWPTPPLLESLTAAVGYGNEHSLKGLWIPFRSWVERVEWKVPHGHLRLWRNKIWWPAKLHSRPMLKGSETEDWPIGHIYHWKSLDEHVRGYLEYLRVSGDNRQWIDHNVMMIEAAVRGSAEAHGWDFVMGHEWWPRVQGRVFQGQDPRRVEATVNPEP